MVAALCREDNDVRLEYVGLVEHDVDGRSNHQAAVTHRVLAQAGVEFKHRQLMTWKGSGHLGHLAVVELVPAPVLGQHRELGDGILLAEAPVFNRTQHYAGTLDGVVEIGGRTLVLDVKTSARGIYPEIGMQLAAYRFAEFVGLPDGSEQAMPATDGAVALHLPDDGTYELREIQADEETFRSFLYVREVYRFLNDIADGVVRGIVPLPGTVTEEQLALAKEVA